MKKLMIFLTALLMLGGTAFAQKGMMGGKGGGMDCTPGQGMHGMGMGHGGCGQACGMHGRAGGPGFGMGGPGHILKMAKALDLSDKQLSDLKELMTEFQMKRVDLQAQLEKSRIELKSLRTDENASEESVMGAIDEVSRNEAEIQKAAYRHHKKVFAILTPDQQKKLKEMMMKGPADDDDDMPGMGMMRRKGAGR